MTASSNPDLDLTISRVIKAPRSAIWSAWTDPASFEQWWVPAPAKCKVLEMDLRPGGALVTEISENGGDFTPHLSGCFLDIVDGERIVFTNALVGGWRPAEQPFMTAIITLQGPSGGHRLRRPRDAQEQRRSKHARGDGLLRRVGHRHGATRQTRRAAVVAER